MWVWSKAVRLVVVNSTRPQQSSCRKQWSLLIAPRALCTTLEGLWTGCACSSPLLAYDTLPCAARTDLPRLCTRLTAWLRAVRKCPNCPGVEDEFHAMFECSHYADIKAKHFDTEGQLYCNVSAGRAAAADIWSKLPHVEGTEFLCTCSVCAGARGRRRRRW